MPRDWEKNNGFVIMGVCYTRVLFHTFSIITRLKNAVHYTGVFVIQGFLTLGFHCKFFFWWGGEEVNQNIAATNLGCPDCPQAIFLCPDN